MVHCIFFPLLSPYILYISSLFWWFLSRCQRRSLRKALHGCIQALLQCLGISLKYPEIITSVSIGKSNMYCFFSSGSFLMPFFVHQSYQFKIGANCPMSDHKMDDISIWAIAVVYCDVEVKTSPHLQTQHQPASTSPGAKASSCSKHVAWHVPQLVLMPELGRSYREVASSGLYTQQKGLWPTDWIPKIVLGWPCPILRCLFKARIA